LRAQGIRNVQGWMGSQGDWSAAATGNIDNGQGTIQSQGVSALAATTLNNANGVLQSASDLTLRLAQDIDNRAGDISAAGRL
ncbi:hypothetical protein LZB78_09835, partial [Campylobacter jejuni]|nr:hypothetical protein [Campylobacter jejuni]